MSSSWALAAGMMAAWLVMLDFVCSEVVIPIEVGQQKTWYLYHVEFYQEEAV